jgi:hypothetical protein
MTMSQQLQNKSLDHRRLENVFYSKIYLVYKFHCKSDQGYLKTDFKKVKSEI